MKLLFYGRGHHKSISSIERMSKSYNIELIITDEVNTLKLDEIVSICQRFFEKEIGKGVDVVKTEQGFDLEYNGIEIGSYGIRSCEYLKWIYATGLAEPRMTIIKGIK